MCLLIVAPFPPFAVLNAGYSEFEDITVLGTATVLGDLNVDSNLDVLGDIKLGGTITNITE